MNASKFRLKHSKHADAESDIGPISHKYGTSSLDIDYLRCITPGCSNKAMNALNGISNQLCVQCWCIMDAKRALTDPSSNPTTRKPTLRKGSVTNAVVDLLESKGKKVPTYKEMHDVVIAVKATSPFNKNHYNWYLNQWKKGKLKRKV